jgi:hypothetical protein
MILRSALRPTVTVLIARSAAPIGRHELAAYPSFASRDLRWTGRARKSFVVRRSPGRRRDVAAETRHHVPRARAGASRVDP